MAPKPYWLVANVRSAERLQDFTWISAVGGDATAPEVSELRF